MAIKDFITKGNAQMAGDITVGGYLAGPATLVIDPAAVGDDTGLLQVKGSLQVDGTTTTINSTTLDVDDLNITVAKGAANSGAADGAGLTVDGANATLTYASTGDKFVFNKALEATSFTGDGSGLTGITTGLTDIVNDTTPQLGGDLDNNGKNINISASSTGSGNNRLTVGPNAEFSLYHNASLGTYMVEKGSGSMRFMASDFKLQNFAGSHEYIVMTDNGSVAISHGNGKKFCLLYTSPSPRDS